MEVLRRLSSRGDLTLMKPSLLKDSNHVTIRVNPDVVARVLLDADENGAAMLAREVDVSRHLAERGAPVTRPTEKPESGPHRFDQACVTFWQYESTIDSDVDIAHAVNSLNLVHQELLHYSGDLPNFWKSADQTYQQLQTPNSRQFLSEGDHRFLKEVFKRFHHLKSL